MAPHIVILVAIGGFFGAPARYLLDLFVSERLASDFPWGTLAVNTSGALLLGLLTGLELHHHLGAGPTALLATGFCGAYTTFSTFGFETVRLVQEGDHLQALSNALGSLTIGMAMAGAGLAIGLGI